MKFISSKAALSDAISMALKAISTRTTLAILEGILIEADETVTLTGYDMETGIECTVETEIREKGSIVINAKMLNEVVRRLPDDLVTVETESDNSVNFKSDKSTVKIRGLDALDYPKIPIVEQAKKLTVSQDILKDMVQQTIFAASSDESRPILNGVNVIAGRDYLELVAIDGFRLAIRRSAFENKTDDMQFIVPAKAMNEVFRIMSNTSDPISIYPSHNHILFETKNVRIVSRLIQGDYMPYRNIIPDSCRSRVIVSSKHLLDAIERAQLVINVEQRRFPVCFVTPNPNELQISAKTDIGHVEDFIPIEMTGDKIDIDFNPKYFMDVLRYVGDDKVAIEFNGATAPCLIKPVSGDGYVYLVLPLRR